MDTYKYLTLITLLVIVTGMGLTFQFPDNGWAAFQAQIDAENSQNSVEYELVTLANGDQIYTPQNPQTQDEGSGGLGISTTTRSGYALFSSMFEGIRQNQQMAQDSSNNPEPIRAMAWYMIGMFWALIGGYGILKFVNWLKNKDTV